MLSIAVGTGVPGYSGDGGPATKAQLKSPTNLVVDRLGSLFITDSGNFRIRKVAPTGTITTVAGDGNPLFPSAISKDNLYTYGHAGEGGPATAIPLIAKLLYPSPLDQGLAVDDSSNLYVSGGGFIRKVSRDGTISIVAGTGNVQMVGANLAASSQVNDPRLMVADGVGNLYVADSGRILKISVKGVAQKILGPRDSFGPRDDRALREETIGATTGLAIDRDGNLYVADLGAAVRRISPSGIISTLEPTKGPGGWFRSLAVDSVGNLYVGGATKSVIQKITQQGAATIIAGNDTAFLSEGGGFWGDGGLATQAGLSSPSSVAVDLNRNLYISDSGNERVRMISSTGVITSMIDKGWVGPWGLAVDSKGSLYFANWPTASVVRISPTGVVTTVAGSREMGRPEQARVPFGVPFGIAIDAADNLFVTTRTDDRTRIWKLSSSGILTVLAGGSPGYSGDNGPALRAQLADPLGMAVDRSGNLYIADGNRIRKISSQGYITTIAGNGESGFSGDGGPAVGAQLGSPFGVAVDDAGNLYIADGSSRIRRVSRDGIILTVAGTGVAGYSGDGGMASSAQLNIPKGVAVDRMGNVYIADTGNNAIRMLKPLK
jgi:sugar lactone lactonase YvrE